MNSTSPTADTQTGQPSAPIKGLVSVIIPAYNQGHYLGAAIESALDQTYASFEIIVVDDGSTDDTPQVTGSFEHRGVQYVYQANAGLSAARNTGIRHSRGEYLTYLDSDDLFTPRKLELLVSQFERDPELGFAAGQAVLIDEHGEPLDKIFNAPPPIEPSDLLLWNPFHVGSTMVRRTWQERAGLFDESLRAYEDWDMWLRLALLGCKMGWAAQPVSLYRFHTAQMTQDRERMTRATFAVLSKVFENPDLPDDWAAKKDLAYSNAYLRAAAQAYRAEAYDEARSAMAQAARLDPSLAANRGASLAARLSALADSPKAVDKLDFLTRIYENLPAELAELERDRNVHLSRAAVDLGFERYQKNDLSGASSYLRRAVHYRPSWLANRGVLSILLRASLAKATRGEARRADQASDPLNIQN